jgi:Raf kinase inhibitor-like YbhB/YbcL family protein
VGVDWIGRRGPCDDAAVKLGAVLVVAGALVLSLTACNTAPKPAPTPTKQGTPDSTQPGGSASPFKAPPPKPSPAKGLTVKSDAFADGKPIPERYTCKGDGDPPPVSWSGNVSGAKNLAVVVKDTDAQGGGFVHWIVLDLPANTTKLEIDNLPDGAQEAVNSDGGTGWTPPCPPSGTHHYHFTVYALDGPTGLPDSAPVEDALAAIKGHYIGYGELVGTVAA